jgi:tetratricopeptide (TPR) repeat protein
MNARLQIAIFAATAVLYGCSHALIPATNDPETKVSQAYEAWHQGRWIPAESLGLDAQKMAEASGNLKAEADAYRFLGNFYKSDLYRQHASWFKDRGRYDPTSKLSLSQFEKAIPLWRKLGDEWGVAAEMFNAGTAYAIDGDIAQSCKLYFQALDTYRSATFAGTTHPWNPRFKDFPSMVQDFADYQKCARGP